MSKDSRMGELLDKLTERERAKCIAEYQASVRVSEAQGKVHEATEELLQLKRTQEQELKHNKYLSEKKLRDAGYACKTRLHQAQKESGQAKARAETAEIAQKRAENHVLNLEQKVQDLKNLIQKRNQASDVECSHVQRVCDDRFEQMAAHADNRVRSMAEHAREVCIATGAALETTGLELQDQMMRATIRAEGRLRHKELRDLSKTFDHITISQDAYDDLKGDLMDMWQIQATLPPKRAGFLCESPAASSPSPLGIVGKTMLQLESDPSWQIHAAGQVMDR